MNEIVEWEERTSEQVYLLQTNSTSTTIQGIQRILASDLWTWVGAFDADFCDSRYDLLLTTTIREQSE